MSETERFHVGDILSITTGRLVSPDHMGGVYRILNHLTSDNLFTHQLPRASRECEPYLRECFPDLAAVEPPEEFDGEEHVKRWLAVVVAEHGEYREVEAMADGTHEYRNPVAEAVETDTAPEWKADPSTIGTATTLEPGKERRLEVVGDREREWVGDELVYDGPCRATPEPASKPCPDPTCDGHLLGGDRGDCSECGAAYVWLEDRATPPIVDRLREAVRQASALLRQVGNAESLEASAYYGMPCGADVFPVADALDRWLAEQEDEDG